MDVAVFEPHIQHVALEPLPMTGLAGQHQVGHELHLHIDYAGSFAFLAPSALRVEGEILGGESQLLGQWLLCKQLSNQVVGLHIGGGIGAGALAYQVLVDKFDMFDEVYVPLQGHELAGRIAHFVEMAFHSGVENAFDKARLSRAGDACDDGHHIERELEVYSFQVVHPATLEHDGVVPCPSG